MSRPTYILKHGHPTRELPQDVNLRLGKSSSAGSLAAVGLGNMMQNCILDIQLFWKFHIFAPENGWLEDEAFLFGIPYFQGQLLNLGRATVWMILGFLSTKFDTKNVFDTMIYIIDTTFVTVSCDII